MRIRTRLSLWHLGVLVAILAAFGAFTYIRFGHELRAAIDTDLRVQAAGVQARLRADPRFELSNYDRVPGTEETFVQIRDRDGRIVDATVDSPGATGGRANTPGPGLTTIRPRGERGEVRLLVVALPDGRSLVVGASLDRVNEALDRFLRVGGTGAIAALCLAGAGAWLLARGTLRPVERMRSEAAAIGASDPSQRLSTPERDDEIGRLAGTLNEMLARLDAAMTRERAFVAEASHDLRTPVAILKSEVELALQEGRTIDELRAALRSAGEEADRLARLADDLMLLTQMASGHAEPRIERVDLSDLVQGAVRRFASIAARDGIVVRRVPAPSVIVEGDRARLERALDNLIDNAIRHSPARRSVEVGVAANGEAAVVSVRDEGPGVATDLGLRLFQPFQRGAGSYQGLGLGLAITKSIARMHGGDATYERRPEGASVFSITLPATSGTSATRPGDAGRVPR